MEKDVEKYLWEKGWKKKVIAGSEINIKVCPLCLRDDWKFYMSPKGLWDCKVCGEKGNLYQLKAKLGDLNEISSLAKLFSKKYQPLKLEKTLLSPRTTEYLEKRGIRQDTAKYFGLYSEGDYLCIPHYFRKEVWNVKKRNIDPIDKDHRFIRVEDRPSVLFNADNVDFKQPVIITEGEMDAISAWQMGVKNVVSITAGAQSFLPEWIPFFNATPKVFLMLDNDFEGEQGAYKIAEKLGLSKCYRVKLPDGIKDANEFLTRNGNQDDFQNLLASSSLFHLKNVTSLADYVDSLDDWIDSGNKISGVKVGDGFDKFDETMQGFKDEDLIVLTGHSGIGKTTFVLNILDGILKQNINCLRFFLEGKIPKLVSRMMTISYDKKFEDLRGSLDWENTKREFREKKLYFFSGQQLDLTPEKLKDLALVAANLYDVKVIIIDNLQSYVPRGGDVVEETDKAIKDLKTIAIDLKIPIILISHLKKPSPDKEFKRPSKYDTKSSSAIYQDADAVIIYWKDSDGKYSCYFDKNRDGVGDIDIPINHNLATGKIREKTYEENVVEEVKGKKEKKGWGLL